MSFVFRSINNFTEPENFKNFTLDFLHRDFISLKHSKWKWIRESALMVGLEMDFSTNGKKYGFLNQM